MLKKLKTFVPTLGLASALALAGMAQNASAQVSTYNVTERFNQIVYNGTPDRDTYFAGSFSFDAASQTVSNLQGYLSQAMTGVDYASQAKRFLTYQLSSVAVDTNGDSINDGLLVSTFFQNSTDVFSGGGFTTGSKMQYGNQNAYVTIFVNLLDPTAALTSAQNHKLAYGDCTTGSLMGAMGTCMTGWLTPTGGVGGTMKGVDQITQTVTAVPEPETYAMLLAGLGLMGTIARRRRNASNV